MSQVFEMSLRQARNIIINHQGLNSGDSAEKILLRMGYIQIDTISVIERAHNHTFWSRNKRYNQKKLAKLIEGRKAFEYWSHAASILPIDSYRFTLPVKKKYLAKNAKIWSASDKKLMLRVKSRIAEEGALCSKDFENSVGKSDGWWGWKPAKKALERLFLSGQLEISKRSHGFQKSFDLSERVIPSSVNKVFPSEEECHDHEIYCYLKSQGIASAEEIAYLCRAETKRKIKHRLIQLVEEGKLISLQLENLDTDFFCKPKALKMTSSPSALIHILSPFDNLVIQRKRLKTVFDFDFQIECYVPREKRKYGYFCLPILYGSKFLGRVDCKADRAEKRFIIQSLHLEEPTSKKIEKMILSELDLFCQFNDCEQVHFSSKK